MEWTNNNATSLLCLLATRCALLLFRHSQTPPNNRLYFDAFACAPPIKENDLLRFARCVGLCVFGKTRTLRRMTKKWLFCFAGCLMERWKCKGCDCSDNEKTTPAHLITLGKFQVYFSIKKIEIILYCYGTTYTYIFIKIDINWNINVIGP